MSEVQMTNTVGYYNGNSWPIHLVISELNVTLNLKPGAYIQDGQKRNINDSYFDKFVRPMQLSKEISKTGPVPLLRVTPVTSTSQNSGHAHAVRTVKNFDAANIKRVDAPAIRPPQLLVNTPSHKGMTVEEARRLGFIGKPKEVPEDYGTTDTAGRPVDVSNAPPIKYAMESTPRLRTKAELPPELTQMDDKVDASQAALRAQLLGGLTKAASAGEESSASFLNSTVTAPEPVVDAGADDPLPPPTIFSPDQLVQRPPEPVNATDAGVNEAAAREVAKPFVCPEDGQTFRYRSQLETYVKRKFPDKVAEIMTKYPAK